ncbi:MAG: cytochrome C [Accumulibacter sp.]|uniref:cytochrome C n=1 Tax=Accumulibacter sp. TaxID=2053492 RepID=UPI0033160959
MNYLSDQSFARRPRAAVRRRQARSLLVGMLLSGALLAEDQRQLVILPPAAQEVLRQEMLENLLVLNEIMTLMAADKLKEAGDLAEQKLGVSAQGKHRSKPFAARPGPHMPPAMHALGLDGHRAASEFARAAQAGERERAATLLPGLTGACVACHFSYRTR